METQVHVRIRRECYVTREHVGLQLVMLTILPTEVDREIMLMLHHIALVWFGSGVGIGGIGGVYRGGIVSPFCEWRQRRRHCQRRRQYHGHYDGGDDLGEGVILPYSDIIESPRSPRVESESNSAPTITSSDDSIATTSHSATS